MSSGRDQSFFVQGPSPNLIDGLLASGLIKEAPQKVLSTENKGKSLKNVQEVVDRLAPIPAAKEKSVKPSIKKPIATKGKPVQSFTSLDRSVFFRTSSDDSLIKLTEKPTKIAATHTCLTSTKKISSGILEQFINIEKEFGVREITDPSQYTQSMSYKLAELYYLINDFALEVKEYNKDYAQAIVIIKSIMQNILEALPQLSKTYEIVIQRMKKESGEKDDLIQQINTMNNDLTKKTKDFDSQLNILKTDLRIMNDKLFNEENSKKDALISIEELKHINDMSSIKIKKLLETKSELEHKIESMNKTIEDQAKGIDELNTLLAKYETDGAGFYPMYQKAAKDHAEAVVKIEELEETIKKLSEKPNYANTETQCDNQDKPSRSSSKRSNVRKRSMSVDDNSSSQSLLEVDQSLTSSILASDDTVESSSIPLSSMNRNMRRIATQKIKDSKSFNNNLHPHALPLFVKETTEEKPKNNTKPRVTFATQDSDLKIKVTETKSDNGEVKSDKKEDKNTKPENKQTEKEDMKKESEPAKKETEKSLEIASDIVLTEKNDATIAFIYQLLYTPPIESRKQNYNEQTNLLIKKDTMNANTKSFSWALNYILTILQNGFNYCSIEDIDKDFSEIVSNVLSDNGKNVQILDRIVSNLMECCRQYQETSKTIQFFLKFVNHKFSISDFLFFNMLYTNCASSIVPPVQTVLEDVDLIDDREYFAINENLIDPLYKKLIKTGKFPDQTKEKLKSQAHIKNHPELVSFWDFSEEMIHLFNDFHFKFHKTVQDIFLLIGSPVGARIGFGEYSDFMHTIIPNITDKNLQNSWKSVLSSTGKSSREVVSIQQLLKYICENQNLVEDIINLPVLDNFDLVLQSIMDSISPLFIFLRTRYIKFIPKLIQALDGNLRNKILEFSEKLRNSLLKCDLSTGFTMYRHILQYVDLRVIESNPFIGITGDIKTEQMNSLINVITMREKIAADSVSVNIETTST